MFNALKDLHISKAMQLAYICFGCFVSPYWYLFNFYPNFSSIDFTQSVIVTLAISLPVFIIELTLSPTKQFIDLVLKDVIDKKDVFLYKLGLAGLNMSLVFYAPSIYYYWIGKIDLLKSLKVIGFVIVTRFLYFFLISILKKSK